MLVVPLRGKRLPSGSRLHVELDKRNAGLHHADRVDVACVPGLVDCRYELAALREIATSALEHEIPLLSILAVPGPLAPHSDLALFEHDVQASIRRSARTGSLDEFAHTLRTPNTLHRCSLQRWGHEDPRQPATDGLPAEVVAALMDAVAFDP